MTKPVKVRRWPMQKRTGKGSEISLGHAFRPNGQTVRIRKPVDAHESWWINLPREQFTDRVKSEEARMRISQNARYLRADD